MLYGTIVLVLTIGIVLQVKFSIDKVVSNLTGTTVDFKQDESNIDLSLTVCAFSDGTAADTESAKWYTFPGLISIDVEDEKWKWQNIYHYKDDNQSVISLFRYFSIFDHYCQTFPLLGGDVKITVKSIIFDYLNAIYLHRTGSFSSGHERRLNSEWLSAKEDMTLLLAEEDIEKIKDPNKCSDHPQFDSCKQKWITNAYLSKWENETCCLLQYMK